MGITNPCRLRHLFGVKGQSAAHTVDVVKTEMKCDSSRKTKTSGENEIVSTVYDSVRSTWVTVLSRLGG